MAVTDDLMMSHDPEAEKREERRGATRGSTALCLVRRLIIADMVFLATFTLLYLISARIEWADFNLTKNILMLPNP